MNFLKANKEELVRRAEWMATQTNDFQMLKAYMHARVSNMDLSADQKKKLERWQFVYNQLSTGRYSEAEVRMQLEQHFKVTQNTAYVDMRQAKELMSTTINLNKRFKIQIDIELLDLMKLKARDANNLDAYAKLQKAQTELYKLIEDQEEVPGDYFVPRENVIQFNPSLLGVEPIPDHQMKKLLDQLKNEFDITDIEYEDTTNGADTSSL